MLGLATNTDFTYNIVEHLLTGKLDGKFISAYAVSGGRAGSKTKGAVNPFLSNNPYATSVKLSNKMPGGPLIMGKYMMKTNPTRANWIRLIPFAENSMKNRDGFAIHGRGPRGSDGCIVPTDFNMVQALYSLLKKHEQEGKPSPTLAVVAIGDLDYLDKKLNILNHTA